MYKGAGLDRKKNQEGYAVSWARDKLRELEMSGERNRSRQSWRCLADVWRPCNVKEFSKCQIERIYL